MIENIMENNVQDSQENEPFDRAAYETYKIFCADSSCLTFDTVSNQYQNSTSNLQQLYLVGGTQAENDEGKLLIMRVDDVKKMVNTMDVEDDENDSCDDEEIDYIPCFTVGIPFTGDVNRLRTFKTSNNIHLCAAMSSTGSISILNTNEAIEALDNKQSMDAFSNKCSFNDLSLLNDSSSSTEGFAICWNPHNEGHLISGDCAGNLKYWKPDETIWKNSVNYCFKSSIEDVCWSGLESNIFAICTVDGSIYICDDRQKTIKATTKTEAHEKDVNVISWNNINKHLIVSGSDDHLLKVWDTRNFKESFLTINYHSAPITSVEWNNNDEGVFIASSEDNTITQCDIYATVDPDCVGTRGDKVLSIQDVEMIANVPSQVLFVHGGQEEIKEVHWHQEWPGYVISTSRDNFNVFKTISV